MGSILRQSRVPDEVIFALLFGMRKNSAMCSLLEAKKLLSVLDKRDIEIVYGKVIPLEIVDEAKRKTTQLTIFANCEILTPNQCKLKEESYDSAQISYLFGKDPSCVGVKREPILSTEYVTCHRSVNLDVIDMLDGICVVWYSNVLQSKSVVRPVIAFSDNVVVTNWDDLSELVDGFGRCDQPSMSPLAIKPNASQSDIVQLSKMSSYESIEIINQLLELSDPSIDRLVEVGYSMIYLKQVDDAECTNALVRLVELVQDDNVGIECLLGSYGFFPSKDGEFSLVVDGDPVIGVLSNGKLQQTLSTYANYTTKWGVTVVPHEALIKKMEIQVHATHIIVDVVGYWLGESDELNEEIVDNVIYGNPKVLDVNISKTIRFDGSIESFLDFDIWSLLVPDPYEAKQNFFKQFDVRLCDFVIYVDSCTAHMYPEGEEHDDFDYWGDDTNDVHETEDEDETEDHPLDDDNQDDDDHDIVENNTNTTWDINEWDD